MEQIITNNTNSSLNELRFSALINATANVLFRATPDWKLIAEFNHHQEAKNEGWNYLVSEWIEKYVFEDDRMFVANAINKTLESQSKYELEYRIIRPDGSIGWVLARAVPVLNDKGELIEWFGSTTDTTYSRQNRDDLKTAYEFSDKQKRVYEAITRNTPDLMYVFDLDYRFTYANEALLEMWGKSWNEAIGKGLIENGYEAWHAEMHEREIDTVKTTGKPVRGEVSFPHAVMGRRTYDYIFTPIFNDEGVVEAVAGTTRDISEIREQDQRKNDFIGMVSHELKTPLTSLLAYQQLLSTQVLKFSDQAISKAVDQSIKQIRKMTTLITGFLSLSRLESGKLIIEKNHFQLEKLFEEIREEVAILHPNHNFTFCQDENYKINADYLKIYQVIMNLISNAVKYSALGTEIKILTKITDDGLMIEVVDEGVGIFKEEIPKLFNRFYRASSNNLISGFGIGLFLCKQIVTGHGGKIWVESELDKGSTFKFTIPNLK